MESLETRSTNEDPWKEAKETKTILRFMEIEAC